jgi:exosortase
VGLNQAVQFAEIATTPPKPDRPLSAWWWQVAIIGASLIWLYHSILRHLVGQWGTDQNFSHGYFVPAFALFVLWERREKLTSLAREPAWSGLWILGFGLCALVAGVVGAELFLSRVSLLLVVAGLTVLLLGWDHLRAVAFPLLFLLLMIPIPRIVFNSITGPLQTLASITAAQMLPLFGIPVLREGNIIHLPTMALEVAEACSGIRSLMSLATLAIIYGYLMEPRASIRVSLAVASIPIAVVANSLRIVGTGLVVQYWDPAKAEGFFHEFSGWLVFVVSLTMIFLVHQIWKAFERAKDTR